MFVLIRSATFNQNSMSWCFFFCVCVFVDLQFNVPDLRVGTLDSLLSLSDDLLKVRNFVFLPFSLSLYVVIHPLRRKFGSYDALLERNHYESIRSFLPLISKLHKIMVPPCICIKSNCILIGFGPLLWIDHLKKEVIYVWFTELGCIFNHGFYKWLIWMWALIGVELDLMPTHRGFWFKGSFFDFKGKCFWWFTVLA